MTHTCKTCKHWREKDFPVGTFATMYHMVRHGVCTNPNEYRQRTQAEEGCSDYEGTET